MYRISFFMTLLALSVRSDSGSSSSSDSSSGLSGQTTLTPQTTEYTGTSHLLVVQPFGGEYCSWGCFQDRSTADRWSNCTGTAGSNPIAVRCCSVDGSSGFTPASCTDGATFDEAEALCEAEGGRLCTQDEICFGNLIEDTGCDFDCRSVWASDNITGNSLCANPVYSTYSAALTSFSMANHAERAMAAMPANDDSASGSDSASSDSDSGLSGQSQTTSTPQTTEFSRHYAVWIDPDGGCSYGCYEDWETAWLYSDCDDGSLDIAVRCCSLDGTSGFTPASCTDGATFDEAQALCETEGGRLCTVDELCWDDLILGSGCNEFDCRRVWASDETCDTTTTVSPSAPFSAGNAGVSETIIVKPAIAANDNSGSDSDSSDSDDSGLSGQSQTTLTPQTTPYTGTSHLLVTSLTSGACYYGCREDRETLSGDPGPCADNSTAIAVRCCSLDGSSGFTPDSCTDGATFDEAKALCEAEGGRLCTQDEICWENLLRGTGCNEFDCRSIWASDEDECDTTTSTDAPAPFSAVNADHVVLSSHSAGSNGETAIGSVIHSEMEKLVEDDGEQQRQPVMADNVTITLSTGTWMNLWGILTVTLLVNLAICVWCLRKQRVEPKGAVRYDESV